MTCLCIHPTKITIHFMEPLGSPCTNSSQILTQTLRILMYNPTTFIAITTLLISPVSAIHLSNILLDQSYFKTMTKTLLHLLKSCGFPSTLFMKQSCQKLSEIAVSSVASFPLHCTLLLISKAAIVYSVECTYLRKKFVPSKFYVILRTIWRRIISTYVLICAFTVACLVLFMIMLICVSRLLDGIGLSRDLITCIVVIVGLLFLAHMFIVCDICMVISVWEDVSGAQAFMSSRVLIKSQTRVGLMVSVGLTIGMAFVKGLFEYRVKSLSYGDGYSRVWERPVLVIFYSFVMLIDFMMSTVLFFSCKSYSLEAVEGMM